MISSICIDAKTGGNSGLLLWSVGERMYSGVSFAALAQLFV